MDSIDELLKMIRPADRAVFEACQEHFDDVAKPVGGLGKMESLLSKVGAASNDPGVDIGKKGVFVFCADNGVAVQGVTQSPMEVTAAVARLLAKGKSSVCQMAQVCGAEIFPIDMGMKAPVPGVRNERMGDGTDDISEGPAMSRSTAIRAIEIGAALVREKKEEGYRLLATGENGMGNTTTSSAMASVLLHLPVTKVTGRGAGLSDVGLKRKKEIIEKAIAVNQPDPEDVIGILTDLGGFDIAAMTGVFLGGAAYHVPVVADGVISLTAALTAVRLKKEVRDYILPSHISAEPAAGKLCRELGLDPILHADMHLGEGTGAVALFGLLDMAAAVYHDTALYQDLDV